ncbi:MAG TPA: aldo/keto reductase [Planctomycetota bacterium]|nr:aldo/keto reductase [Planctomycetota bacterium]
MIKRAFGFSDMTISVVGFGAFVAGGWMWGSQDDADTVKAVHAAVDAGVNWIDTAPIYGSGKADAAVAAALRDLLPSQRPFIFTKFGHHLVDGKRISSATKAEVVRDCEYNLKAFGVERLDLFQLHWPTPVPIAETAGACGELLKAGKIRAVGVSNFSVAQLAEWHATGVPLHSVQNAYSIVKPDAEMDVLPWCFEHNLGFLAYSPLQRGLLFGHWTREKTFPAGDHRSERADFRGPRLARYLDAVDELKVIAEEDEMNVAQLAIGCLLCVEGFTAAIVGARNAEQGALLGDLGIPVKAKHLAAVDDVMARLTKDLATIGE